MFAPIFHDTANVAVCMEKGKSVWYDKSNTIKFAENEVYQNEL